MKKIPSLFKRDYEGNRQVIDEVTPGCEWVIEGEGVPTIKLDGECCMVRDGRLYKRLDRKLKTGKALKRQGYFFSYLKPGVDVRKKSGKTFMTGRKTDTIVEVHRDISVAVLLHSPDAIDLRNLVPVGIELPEHFYRNVPDTWEPCEPKPDLFTGHWPGWVLVDFNLPENKWYKKAWEELTFELSNGTYEFVGPKVQGNPYGLQKHTFAKHSFEFINLYVPRTYGELKEWFADMKMEGVVWHHDDGRMVKIKRSDFGYEWPVKNEK